MHVANEVRANFYLDSVALMRISADLNDNPMIDQCALMMGTPSNKAVLQGAGLLDATGEEAGPDDLIVAVCTNDAQALDAAIAKANLALTGPGGKSTTRSVWQPTSIASAISHLPGANLALVSVASDYAVTEAMRALTRGLNVMMFTDNVPLEEEVRLKRYASEQGLLVMGPDCGTAYIAGTPIAFANAVSSGSVGVIAASGTGLQAVAVALDAAGAGISHGLGVGGRDFQDAIGGISANRALDLLLNDPQTERIVVITKPPGPDTAEQFFARLAQSSKPTGVYAVGLDRAALPTNVAYLESLKAAAEWASGEPLGWDSESVHRLAQELKAKHRLGPRSRVCGIFAGGTLCLEAQAIFEARGLRTTSNAPLASVTKGHAEASHRMLDLGADEFTVGRPHPMLDGRVRNDAAIEALRDFDIVLVDFILGYGADNDPTRAFLTCLADCEETPVVIASLVGTNQDPQGLAGHRARLVEAGVVVAPTTTDAAELAASLVLEGGA